jgi:hypothetical protein
MTRSWTIAGQAEAFRVCGIRSPQWAASIQQSIWLYSINDPDQLHFTGPERGAIAAYAKRLMDSGFTDLVGSKLEKCRSLINSPILAALDRFQIAATGNYH